VVLVAGDRNYILELCCYDMLAAAVKDSPSRPLKRRILWEDTTQRGETTANACMSPDSESAKGHPELLVNRLSATAAVRQKKYSMIRLKHILPLLLLLAAGVPFIVHLKLLRQIQLQNQLEHKVDDHQWRKNNDTYERREPKIMSQLDTHDTHKIVPRKRDQFLRYPPSKKRQIMIFHSFPERDDPLPHWDLLMPNSDESITTDRWTVSLKVGSTVGNMIVRSRHVQESSGDNVKELISKDKNVTSNVDNTSSTDELVPLISEAAAWDPEQECVPMADWQTTFHPSCNSMHEMDMPSLLNKEAYSLVSNKGFWRNAWKVDMKVAENGMSPVSHIVIKSLKYYHKPNDETFELNRVDAVSMEILTQSNYITDIYGYCGTTSLQEFAGAGDLAKFLPKLKPIEKLGMAAWVSSGIADIHEVGKKADADPTAVATAAAPLIHNDINMDNILLGERDGIKVPLLNDFNIAIFRKRDVSSGEPCRFRGRFSNPQWMSPEQMVTGDREDGLSHGFLNEKIDVYALGNILYKVAVGKSPWKYNFNKVDILTKEHTEKITRAKLKGGKPMVPDGVKNSKDPSIQAVLTAMSRCYRNDPDIRPTAREVSDYLNKKFLELGRKTNSFNTNK